MTPLIEALSQPKLYPHAVEQVKVIETHISWILLAGDYAYKVKKDVTLPFADFSTLEARRYYCEQELELNRRLAPELYLDVATITGSATYPELDGEGEVIEYAVRMLRFEQDEIFHQLLASGELTPELMRQLASRIAEFHAELPPAAGDSGYGTPEAVLEPALANFREMAQQRAPTRAAELEELRQWTESEGKKLHPLFAQRHRDGFIRECHGDLHLGNIARVEGRPVAFDCLEFSAELRWIDVINEVAFVVMDCIDRGRSDLGYHFLDAYLQVRGDFDGVALLRFYMVYRAMVRAKVQGLQAGQADDEGAPDRAEQLRAAADEYVTLAQRLIHGDQPVLILMHGFSASGKSRVAAELLARLGAVRVRSDVERKRLFELDSTDDSGSGLDSGIYQPDASERTYDHLAGTAEAILRAGHPVVVDAAFLKQWQRARLEDVAQRRGVALRIVDCAAETATLRERVQARRERGGDPSEATTDVLEHQLSTHEPITDTEAQALVRCDMNGADEAASLRQCVARVTRSLRES